MASRGARVVILGSNNDVSVFYGDDEDAIWIKVADKQTKVSVVELREAIDYVMGESIVTER